MNSKTEKFNKIIQSLRETNSANTESSLMDLMYEIEECPAHSELPPLLQIASGIVASRIIERSWPAEHLALGFFVLGKAAIYPGELDVTNIASKIMSKICCQREARQILVSIENQILSDQKIDQSAGKIVLKFLVNDQEVWGNDICLRDRVIEGITDKII